MQLDFYSSCRFCSIWRVPDADDISCFLWNSCTPPLSWHHLSTHPHSVSGSFDKNDIFSNEPFSSKNIRMRVWLFDSRFLFQIFVIDVVSVDTHMNVWLMLLWVVFFFSEKILKILWNRFLGNLWIYSNYWVFHII